jgi:hypothetical protein
MRVVISLKFAGPQTTVDEEQLQLLARGVYERLGYLAVYANELDDRLFELYWIITQRPRNEVVAELGGHTLGVLKNRFLAAYPMLSDQALVAKFAAVEDRLKRAVELRNEYMHASWAVCPDGWIQRERRPRDRPVEHIVRMMPSHIEDAANEIAAVGALLDDLHDQTMEALGGKLPPQGGEIRDGVSYPRTLLHEDWTQK